VNSLSVAARSSDSLRNKSTVTIRSPKGRARQEQPRQPDGGGQGLSGHLPDRPGHKAIGPPLDWTCSKARTGSPAIFVLCVNHEAYSGGTLECADSLALSLSLSWQAVERFDAYHLRKIPGVPRVARCFVLRCPQVLCVTLLAMMQRGFVRPSVETPLHIPRADRDS